MNTSSKGLGAALLQHDSPIAYASRSLTNCEKNYAQIKKEMLFGCTRFHDYIYGMPQVVVETDHKPLKAILKKLLHRLQKMIMTIQRYQVQAWQQVSHS